MFNIEFLIRITLCFILGSLIGLERQYRRKSVGIRTITLVSLGSFLFVSISNLLPTGDTTRIAAQVVSGIGFLGAGVILRDGTNIRGLNTAATLWCSAAVGALTASGLLIEAIIGVAYILLANLFLRFVSRSLLRKTIHSKIINYNLKISCEEEKEGIIKNTLLQRLKHNQICIKSFSTKKNDNQIGLEIEMEVESNFKEDINTIINKLCLEEGIISVKYDNATKFLEDDDDDYEDKY